MDGFWDGCSIVVLIWRYEGRQMDGRLKTAWIGDQRTAGKEEESIRVNMAG